MEALGIPRGSYVVKVNNRKVLEGIRKELSIDDDGRWLTVLRAIDKLDRLRLDGVRALLGDGRVDESGDFTKGAGLDASQTAVIVNFLRWQPTAFVSYEDEGKQSETQVLSSNERLEAMRDTFAQNPLALEGLEELSIISRLARSAGYDDDRILIDTSVVRGLEYYTGPVYEVELTLETKDEKGRPVRFGSVGGGGRYDGLVSRFRGEPVPATGFSIGVSRLQAALTMLGKLDTTPEFGPVVVTVFDRDRVADYQKMVAVLRAANIRAELYLGNPKNMGNQLKYADKRNSPCVIIQGSDEKDDPAGPQVLLKDLILGAELAKLEKDRDEYLQKQGEAQTKVPQAALVSEVRKILDKHGVKWK
jgi:histidyl-tRNA synthetase